MRTHDESYGHTWQLRHQNGGIGGVSEEKRLVLRVFCLRVLPVEMKVGPRLKTVFWGGFLEVSSRNCPMMPLGF